MFDDYILNKHIHFANNSMNKFKESFKSKKTFKQKIGKCQICKEKEYSLLDTHRYIITGKDGGKYSNNNCLCLCTTCHRLVHAEKIKIIGIFHSTMGKVLIYIDQNNKEIIKKI